MSVITVRSAHLLSGERPALSPHLCSGFFIINASVIAGAVHYSRSTVATSACCVRHRSFHQYARGCEDTRGKTAPQSRACALGTGGRCFDTTDHDKQRSDSKKASQAAAESRRMIVFCPFLLADTKKTSSRSCRGHQSVRSNKQTVQRERWRTLVSDS